MENDEKATPEESTPISETSQETPETDQTPPPVQTVEATVEAPVELSADERMWGMLCHLSALAGLIGLPFGNILGPLIIWLIKKEEYAFVNSQGKESLNFQIIVTIAIIITIPIAFFTCGFGIILTIAVMIGSLVCVVIAAMKANAGEEYKYPVNFPFIK